MQRDATTMAHGVAGRVGIALGLVLAIGCGGSPGARNDATAAERAEWRVYQDVLERRRLELPVAASAGGARLVSAPAFVVLEAGATLVTDPGRPMPLGRYPLVVVVTSDGREQRIELVLQVMPVV